jgi:hypothetical protein
MITTSALGAQLGEVGRDGELLPPAQSAGFRIVKFMPSVKESPAEVYSKYFNLEDVPRHPIPLRREDPKKW